MTKRKEMFATDIFDAFGSSNSIVDCTIVDDVDFELPTRKESIFRGVEFVGFFDLRNVKDNGKSVIFHRCQFRKSVLVSSAELKGILFLDCIFEDDVRVEYCDIKDFGLMNNNVSKSLHFYQGQINKLVVDKCYGNGELSASSVDCSELELRSNYGNLDFDVSSNYFRGIKSEHQFPSIQKLTVISTAEFSGSIVIRSYSIEYLVLSGHIKQASIEIFSCIVGKCLMSEFVNYGTTQIGTIDFLDTSSLQVINCSLGKAELFDIDFKSCGSVSMRSVNLINIVTADVVWCSTVQSVTIHGKSDFAVLREVYRQLKNVAESQKDKPEELRFYSLEMTAYREQLKIERPRSADGLILWLNRITNNHGMSYFQPFLWIVVFLLGFYFPIKGLLGNHEVKGIYIWSNCAEILETINPVRKFADSYGLSDDPVLNQPYHIAKGLDVIQRIVLSYLIFQFIKAFRKFVRN